MGTGAANAFPFLLGLFQDLHGLPDDRWWTSGRRREEVTVVAETRDVN